MLNRTLPAAVLVIFAAALLPVRAGEITITVEPSAAPAPALEEPPVEEELLAITVGELQQLLDRKQQPRLEILNKYRAKSRGTALRIEKGMLYYDITGEGLGVDGVMAVKLSQIVSLDVLVPLTPAQLEAARVETAKLLARLKERRSKPPEKADATVPVDASEAAEAPEAPPQAPDAGKKEQDLLEMYPPGEGWGPARFGEIVRKRVVLGLQPFGKDETFLKDYDAWRDAYQARRKKQLEMKAEYEASGKEAPKGFEVLPELPPAAAAGA